MYARLLEKMIGATVIAISCLEKESDLVTIVTDIGNFEFQHDQDCCEDVALNDFEYEDMVGLVITAASEECSGLEYEADSYEHGTWTFYKIEASKDGKGGSLWMRWLGASNGYYSERVDIKFHARKASV
jgi:hypothetical protein